MVNIPVISRNIDFAFCLSLGSDVERDFVFGGDQYAADFNDDNELVYNNADRGARLRNGECRYFSSSE